VSSEVTRLATIITRMDQFDANLVQQRLESGRAIEELDKEVKKLEEDDKDAPGGIKAWKPACSICAKSGSHPLAWKSPSLNRGRAGNPPGAYDR
jgi:hypothetical protein